MNSPVPVIQVDAKTYYSLKDGVWFAASAATGPWTVATTVPAAIYTIPPSLPLHYVTYVHVYNSTPQTVYVGYTPGYYGTVVAPSSVVVYGTGYVYPPVYVGAYWYPPPPTYGYGAGFGWGAVTGFAFGAMTAAAWGGAWGCCGYDDVDINRNVNINRNDAYNRWNQNQVRSNLESRAQSLTPQQRQQAQQRAQQAGQARGATPRANDVYAGSDGSTYRRGAEGAGAEQGTGLGPGRTRLGQGVGDRPESPAAGEERGSGPRGLPPAQRRRQRGEPGQRVAAVRWRRWGAGGGRRRPRRRGRRTPAVSAALGAAVPEAPERGAGAGARPRAVAPSDVWLVSERADFWVASAGGASLLVALGLVLLWHGNRELDAADVLLSELHLGATYDAIVRRRLWRRMPLDVLAVPLAIVAATYALVLNGWPLLVTTTILYLGAWHRGRQNLGIARYYQRRVGGPVSSGHRWLLPGGLLSPHDRGGRLLHEHLADPRGGGLPRSLARAPGSCRGLGVVAAASIAVYLGWTIGRTAGNVEGPRAARGRPAAVVHLGERWLVLANAAAFGDAYVLGAWTASFILVLAVHHEVQYLYFTYALARRGDSSGGPGLLPELRRLARFAVWPAIGLASWAACAFSGLDALLPFLTGGLLAHYWLDGRIWTARARRLAAA